MLYFYTIFSLFYAYTLLSYADMENERKSKGISIRQLELVSYKLATHVLQKK